MNILDINGWEFILLIVIGVVVLGPERLPEYAAKLRVLIRQVRAMADSARGQLREQMGPEFDDIDWKAFDPRQYDPRRIVREALLEDGEEDFSAYNPFKEPSRPRRDPALPTPWDVDAT